MRVWVDLTNSPHVLVLRPLIERLRQRGHEVLVTARDHAQTQELLQRFGIPYLPVGHHGGGRLSGRAAAFASRSRALFAFAKRNGPFAIALGHGSVELNFVARLLGIPATTAFDYEFARLQHHLNCRLARTVVVPELIPAERLRPYGALPKLARYPGLKEEYYLADFTPNPAVLEELRIDPQRPLVVVRTPPTGALYHRFESPLFAALLELLASRARDGGLQVVVLPRGANQREALAGRAELIVPERAVDAQSLISYASLVISGGGTMNREAVALGTPVATTFQGRLGAVDEALIKEGRLRRCRTAEELAAVLAEPLVPPAAAGRRPRRQRDVELLLSLFLRPVQPAYR